MKEFAGYPAIHSSGIREHQRCRRKWFLGDRHWGLGYRPTPTNSSAAVGTLVHGAMHYRYGLSFSWEMAFDLAVEEWEHHLVELGVWDLIDDIWYAETITLAQAVVRGYGMHYETARQYLDDGNLEVISTEQKFSIKVGMFTVEGIWDAVVRHKQTGQLWVFESKTTGNVERIVDGIQWDYQPQLYVAAAQRLYPDEVVAGVIYNIVKRTDPFTVKMLQNGMPSTAKDERAGTTVAVYREVVEQGLTQLPDNKRETERVKYEALIAEMEAIPSRLYVRHAVVFNPEQIENVLRYIELEANAMIGTASLGEAVQPSFDRYTCGGCSYRWACQALNDGSDWQEILDTTMVREVEGAYGDEATSTDDE